MKDIDKITEIFKEYPAVGEHGFKHFAVLMPLCQVADKPAILYEVRAAKLDRQPGEICFPGGLIEKGENPLECALRETEEEVGISPENIRIITKMDSVHSTGGSQIHCFLGEVEPEVLKDPSWLDSLNYSRDEVAEAFAVSLEELLNTEPEVYESILRQEPDPDFPYDRVTGGEMYPWRSGKAPVPIYTVKDIKGRKRVIWGLTGRMTKQFLEVITEVAPKTPKEVNQCSD